MSLARYMPNTRESAEDIKRRAWQYEGIVVADCERDSMPWEFREWLKQWAEQRFGPRRGSRSNG